MKISIAPHNDTTERGIVIDDNCDSEESNDDTIGIKTWFNERYVKHSRLSVIKETKKRQIPFRIINEIGVKKDENR